MNGTNPKYPGLVGVAETRLLVSPPQQPLAAAGQFIRYQDGDQVDVLAAHLCLVEGKANLLLYGFRKLRQDTVGVGN